MTEINTVISELNDNDAMHMARILILVNSIENGGSKVDSLTKLAKLDFLLRYPVYLERALVQLKLPTVGVCTRDFERHSVESAMVRYRYGPWDFRYRRLLNLLAAKSLIVIKTETKATSIQLTQKGTEIAESLREMEAFMDITYRSEILSKNFDQTGGWLIHFIYNTFPEIISLTSGKKIQ